MCQIEVVACGSCALARGNQEGRKQLVHDGVLHAREFADERFEAIDPFRATEHGLQPSRSDVAFRICEEPARYASQVMIFSRNQIEQLPKTGGSVAHKGTPVRTASSSIGRLGMPRR